MEERVYFCLQFFILFFISVKNLIPDKQHIRLRQRESGKYTHYL